MKALRSTSSMAGWRLARAFYRRFDRRIFQNNSSRGLASLMLEFLQEVRNSLVRRLVVNGLGVDEAFVLDSPLSLVPVTKEA